MAVKRVELPPFDGTDPVGWITRAETYFEVQGTSEEVKVRLAKLSMEGATIHWFNLLRATEKDLTWARMKRALIDRYGGRQSGNPFEELKDLIQTGSVEEYVSEFEFISSQVDRLPEEQYMGYFLGGLRSDIRLRVRTLNPVNRLQAMRCARDVEAELLGVSMPRNSGMRGWKGNKEWRSGYVEVGPGAGQNPNMGKLGYGPGPIKGTQHQVFPFQNESRTVTSHGTRNNSQEGRRFFTNDRNRGIMF
ncbi:putative succinate dehydrogenase (quinone) [Lupinus albus]|uniref:Putative succinate dehydrogenase (Quinone) n=1 Tax=Lupinus albus TaxID=3870 RepID=A0A6A4PMT9_LUPAL|nr:putative succinate dehydrogenase (quinone) [Lupinus albus]